MHVKNEKYLLGGRLGGQKKTYKHKPTYNYMGENMYKMAEMRKLKRDKCSINTKKTTAKLQ